MYVSGLLFVVIKFPFVRSHRRIFALILLVVVVFIRGFVFFLSHIHPFIRSSLSQYFIHSHFVVVVFSFHFVHFLLLLNTRLHNDKTIWGAEKNGIVIENRRQITMAHKMLTAIETRHTDERPQQQKKLSGIPKIQIVHVCWIQHLLSHFVYVSRFKRCEIHLLWYHIFAAAATYVSRVDQVTVIVSSL